MISLCKFGSSTQRNDQFRVITWTSRYRGGILEDIGQFPTRVRERDSQTHVLLRVTEAAHRSSPLYPGDPTMVFTFPYVMDDKRFRDKALLQEKLQVTVFAEGRKIQIESRVEDIIDF